MYNNNSSHSIVDLFFGAMAGKKEGKHILDILIIK